MLMSNRKVWVWLGWSVFLAYILFYVFYLWEGNPKNYATLTEKTGDFIFFSGYLVLWFFAPHLYEFVFGMNYRFWGKIVAGITLPWISISTIYVLGYFLFFLIILEILLGIILFGLTSLKLFKPDFPLEFE